MCIVLADDERGGGGGVQSAGHSNGKSFSRGIEDEARRRAWACVMRAFVRLCIRAVEIIAVGSGLLFSSSLCAPGSKYFLAVAFAVPDQWQPW